MERSLTTGSKGAGFAATLCFVAILKTPVPSFSMKTLGEEGTVPRRVFAQHLTPHDPPRSPARHSEGGWHAHPAGSGGPPRGFSAEVWAQPSAKSHSGGARKAHACPPW